MYVQNLVGYRPENTVNEKSARRRRKHCALAVVRPSQKFRPAADPLPGGAGRPKFNQLETVTTYLQTQFGEDRCTQFRVVVVTDPTHKETGPIAIHCAAASAQCKYLTQLYVYERAALAERLRR